MFLIRLLFVFVLGIKGYSQACDLNPEQAFVKSSKFLVHIGFSKGFPEDGVMRPGITDAAIYFSLNGPFPPTKLMPYLDQKDSVLIVPFDEKLIPNILSFHPTETLLAKFTITKGCTLVCPEGEKIPSYYAREGVKITSYKKSDNRVAMRNQAVNTLIEGLGGYPATIQLDEEGSWDNTTIVEAKVKGIPLNINKKDLYPFLVRFPISYACPGQSSKLENGKWKPIGMGILSSLKGYLSGCLPTDNLKEDIATNRADILQWVEKEASWLSFEAKTSFITNIDKLIEGVELGKKSKEICFIQ